MASGNVPRSGRAGLLRPLTGIALLTLAGMTVFEILKQIIHPQISIWQSHIVTILFSAVVAVAAGTVVLRRIHHAHRRALNEMKRAEVERAERMASLSTLTMGLAHEIKNPLAAMLSSAQAALNLKEKPDQGEKLAKSLENVVTSAQRCNEIVEKLRTFVGRKQMERRPENIVEVVHQAIHFSRPFCENHQATVELTAEPDLPAVPLDVAEIELLLLNLIQNSIQAGEKKVEIAVQQGHNKEWVSLIVRDNGSGITEEARRRAFEPFFSTRQDKGGMGLGLSIAYGIVLDHGGHIRINGAPGKGTTVSVELPTVMTKP